MRRRSTIVALCAGVVLASPSNENECNNWRRSFVKRKTPEEMERARIAKIQRTLIRLRHSIAADEEINRVLPDTLDDFDAALQRGELKALVVDLNDVEVTVDALAD